MKDIDEKKEGIQETDEERDARIEKEIEEENSGEQTDTKPKTQEETFEDFEEDEDEAEPLTPKELFRKNYPKEKLMVNAGKLKHNTTLNKRDDKGVIIESENVNPVLYRGDPFPMSVKGSTADKKAHADKIRYFLKEKVLIKVP